jgi:hypothetical protein
MSLHESHCASKLYMHTYVHARLNNHGCSTCACMSHTALQSCTCIRTYMHDLIIMAAQRALAWATPRLRAVHAYIRTYTHPCLYTQVKNLSYRSQPPKLRDILRKNRDIHTYKITHTHTGTKSLISITTTKVARHPPQKISPFHHIIHRDIYTQTITHTNTGTKSLRSITARRCAIFCAKSGTRPWCRHS